MTVKESDDEVGWRSNNYRTCRRSLSLNTGMGRIWFEQGPDRKSASPAPGKPV